MATIHKRRLGSGDIVWELTHGTGRDRQRFTAGRSKEEAQVTLSQFEKQLALHGQAPADDGLDAVVGLYHTFLKTNRRSSTIRRYLRVIRTFHHCFLNVYYPHILSLRQIKPLHIEAYKTHRIDGTLTETDDEENLTRDAQLKDVLASAPGAPQRRDNAKFGWLGRRRFQLKITPSTVNYELRALGTFFRWAVSRNYLFVNPATPVERLRISKRALPKFLTADYLKQLFEACRDTERRLFMTILLTGMRKGEVMHLTWADINFELGIIFIQEKPQWNWKPKTDERVIPMSPTLRGVLRMQHGLRRDDELVFPNKEGHPDTHILPKLQNICRRAGLKPATVHSLRHSFGAHLRMAGVSLADIADLLGHKDLATTQIYAKVQQEHLRSVIAKLGPIVGEMAPSHTPRILEAATEALRLPKGLPEK